MTKANTDEALPVQHQPSPTDHATTACGAPWEYHADTDHTQACDACTTATTP